MNNKERCTEYFIINCNIKDLDTIEWKDLKKCFKIVNENRSIEKGFYPIEKDDGSYSGFKLVKTRKVTFISYEPEKRSKFKI